jgi:CheY-like chemotaxis protein
MVAAWTGGAKVLVVEDDALARESIRTILEARGFSVAAAGNGREALNYLQTHRPPQVILLDLMMPVMNGWEFRRHQKQHPGLAAIPVVVCSGVDDVPAEAALVGAQGHLQKPIQLDELVQTVSHFCVNGSS